MKFFKRYTHYVKGYIHSPRGVKEAQVRVEDKYKNSIIRCNILDTFNNYTKIEYDSLEFGITEVWIESYKVHKIMNLLELNAFIRDEIQIIDGKIKGHFNHYKDKIQLLENNYSNLNLQIAEIKVVMNKLYQEIVDLKNRRGKK